MAKDEYEQRQFWESKEDLIKRKLAAVWESVWNGKSAESFEKGKFDYVNLVQIKDEDNSK